MLQVKEKAAKLQNLIFSYRPAEFESTLMEFIDLLDNSSCVQTNEPGFSPLLQSLLSAFQQKDYLLFADLLEYKMHPLLRDTKAEEEV